MQFIETERLYMRRLVPSDVQGMFELDSNPEVHRFLGNTPVTTLEQSAGWIENIMEQYKTNGTGRWAVLLKETGEFLGWAGIKLERNVNGRDKFYDLGYRFIEKHWGKGYATEAAKAFVDYAFKVMDLPVLNAYADAAHTASRNVLEKAGLQFVEVFDYEGVEEVWYEIKNPAR